MVSDLPAGYDSWRTTPPEPRCAQDCACESCADTHPDCIGPVQSCDDCREDNGGCLVYLSNRHVARVKAAIRAIRGQS